MMNMMTGAAFNGAVAINGGVGVMEIRRPQVAESVAQAAAQMTLNAHITLRELKAMIDTVVEKKLPTFKTLMEMNPVAVARTTVNGAKLTAYENGYAVYEVDDAHTVMAVDRCGDYRYDFTDGTHAYNAAGFCNETILSDDFPELPEGKTQITWTGGITAVEVIPRWWTL